MTYFCEKCMCMHTDEEICPHIKKQIKENPELLSQAATFTNIAGQYRLITSQDLQIIANKINQLVGVNLKYEGTHQFSRDIQVFKRLNEEAYKGIGAFNSPQAAQNYLTNATQKQLTNLIAKIDGSAQEVDWLRFKQSQLRSLFEKNELFNGNAAGVDGQTVNRFTGEIISKTTIKAAQTKGGLNTNVQGIIKSLKNGTLSPNDVVFGVDGTKEALMKKLSKEIAYAKSINDTNTVSTLTAAQQKLTTTEFSNAKVVKTSADRLKEKIANGQATTSVTLEQTVGKMAQGAIIGATISLTISSISSYIRYKNGEITLQQAITDTAEDTTKGTIIGAGMAGITLFLPAGAVGFCAGLAIGIYVNATLTNILDEVFGKGAYREIFIANGYIMGTSMNLSEALQQFKRDRENIEIQKNQIVNHQKQTKNNFDEFDRIMEEI